MNTTRHCLTAALLLAVYWAFMFHIALFAPPEISTFMFIEGGTVESVTPYLWFVLAVWCLFGRLTLPTRLASALSAVLLGLHEMDLHKSFFQEETFRTHFLRSNFYRSDIVPLSHKIIGGGLAVLILVLAVYLAKTFFSALKHRNTPFQAAHVYTLATVFLLAAAKFADRLNGQMEEFLHRSLPPHIEIVVQAFEESAEMLAPVLLCIALILYSGRPLPAGK